MTAPCLEFVGVSKAYVGKTVLDNINLILPSRLTVAMVGESGSGKSTLLQLANGLVRPEAGSVSIFGEPLDYAALSEKRRAMGYAGQGAGWFPH